MHRRPAGLFQALVVLLMLSALHTPVRADSTCVQYAELAGYGVIGHAGFTYGNNSIINNNDITGSIGNTPTPSGQVDNVSLTFPPIEPASFPGGGSNVSDRDSLAPGTYGTVTIKTNQTFFLSPGDYFIDEFDIGNKVELVIQPPGQVRLYIGSELKAGNEFELNSSGATGDLLLFLYGGASFTAGNANLGDSDLDFNGLLYSPYPDTHIEFGNNNEIRGAILSAGTLTVGNNTLFDYSAAVQQTVLDKVGCAAEARPHHIRIEHDGSGLTCAVTTLTIKACANETCSSLYTAGDITGTLSSSEGGVFWIGGSAAFSIGTSGYTTKAVQPATTSWGVASVNPAPETGYECDNTSDNISANDNTQCQFSATSAAFIVSDSRTGDRKNISPQTAGKPSDGYYLRAVKSSTDNPAVCTPTIIDQSNVEVAFAYTCIDPSTCTAGNMLFINSTAVPSGGVSIIRLDFDENGAASIPLRYDDVGKITINASKTITPDDGTAVTLTGSTNAFVVKPYGFRLDGLGCAAGDNPSKAADAFCVAGGTFTGNVEAVRYDPSAPYRLGAATPSFGHESAPQTVTFEPAALINPTKDVGDPVNDFALSSTGGFGDTPNHAIATMTWPNVGTIRIKPTMDYLDAGDLTTEGRNDSIAFAGDVGRFYPHHFALSAGSIRPACMDDGFTYMDQPALGITFTIEARNKAEGVTTNYFTGYPDLATVGVVAESANSATDLGSRIGGLGMPSWTLGKYAVDVENAMFSRSLSPDGPFDDLAIGVKVTDGIDNTPLAGATQIGSATKLRFGRLRLSNVYGYYASLQMPVEAQYWSGKSWVLNTDDNCTAIADGHLAADQAGWTLTAPGTLAAGRGAITLSLDDGAARSARICVDLGADPATGIDCDAAASADLPWLQGKWPPGAGHDNDPWATATFGVFRQEGRKGIYNRELY